MINLRSIGTTCDQCDDCMSVVHSVTAECWVWGFRRFNTIPSFITASAGNVEWTDSAGMSMALSHEAFKAYRTLTISGLKSPYGDPTKNGTYTITDWILGPATAAQDTDYATIWYYIDFRPTTISRATGVTHTATGLTYTVEEFNGSAWVTYATVTATLSDEISDQDIADHLDALLDAIDWDDVLMFDDAHNFSYTVFKVPTLVAGLGGHDQFCVGDQLSASSAGDTIITSNRLVLNQGRKVTAAYGLRCWLSSDATVNQLWKGPYASLTTGLIAPFAFRQRVRLPEPPSYSHSVYFDPYLSPYYLHQSTDHFADTRHSLSSWIGIEDSPAGAPYDRWVASGGCTNVRRQTSVSSAEIIEAPELVGATGGNAQHAARVIRQGIRCQDNYPAEFNYP